MSATTSESVRAQNLSRVLTAVHRAGALSRADLTRLTGLNRSTNRRTVCGVRAISGTSTIAWFPAATTFSIARK